MSIALRLFINYVCYLLIDKGVKPAGKIYQSRLISGSKYREVNNDSETNAGGDSQAVWEEDSYVFILGRKKDMIIVSGHNVYPVDVEDVLHTHPKVAEAAVIGVPDKTRGEVVKAFVSLKKGEVATEAEIKKFCRERLVDYKVPKEVIIMDALPKTGSGKIRKQDLRK